MTSTNGRKPTKLDFKSKLKAAKLPSTTIPVCLRADLVAEMAALDIQLRNITMPADQDRLVGNAAAVRLSQQIEALRQEMIAGSEDFVLRAIPRPRMREIEAAHPPRDGNARDEATGYNLDAVMQQVLRESIVSPVMDDETWAELVAVLSDGQWDELTDGAWEVNKGRVSVPFSPRASQILRSLPGSKPPNG